MMEFLLLLLLYEIILSYMIIFVNVGIFKGWGGFWNVCPRSLECVTMKESSFER